MGTLVLVAGAVAVAAGPARAQVDVGPARTISEVGAVGPMHTAVDVGSGAGRFTALWSDNRDGCPVSTTNINDCAGAVRHVYGAGLDATGALDRPQIGVDVDPDDTTSPALAFGDTHYLAVFWRAGSLWAVALDTIGGPDGTQPTFELAASAGNEIVVKPAVAWATASWLVVWPTGAGLRAARVSPDTGLVDVTPLELTTGTEDGVYERPRIACDGGTCMVVFVDGNGDLRGVRVAESDGAVLDTPPLAIAPQAMYGPTSAPAVASDGSGYLVTFSTGSAGAGAVQAVLVEPDGTVPQLNRATIHAGSDAAEPAVAATGSGFLVVWSQRDPGDVGNSWGGIGIRGMRVERGAGGLDLLDPGGFPIVNRLDVYEAAPRVAGGGGRFYAVWLERADSMTQADTPFGVGGALIELAGGTPGEVDAGPGGGAPDAGAGDGGGKDASGCAVGSSRGPGAVALALLGLLALAARRRRRQR